jgi:hypothetical protein
VNCKNSVTQPVVIIVPSVYRSRDGSVGIAIRCVLDDWGSIPTRGKPGHPSLSWGALNPCPTDSGVKAADA